MGVQQANFQTQDNVTLRGLFYTPEDYSGEKLPCIVLSHGFSAIKEMGLTASAEYFVANIPVTAFAYDNRGFGESDTLPGVPRVDVDPWKQCSDIQDAITYVQTRSEVDPKKIGIWGSSFSGGNVLWTSAIDRRVKAVVAQAPLIDGFSGFAHLLRADDIADWEAEFEKDRIARAAGKPAAMVSVVDPDRSKRSTMTTRDSNAAMGGAEKFHARWRNETTLKSMENLRSHPGAAWIHRISPTPLHLCVGDNDVVTPTADALAAFNRAHEPKELFIFSGGHYEAYAPGPNFEACSKAQAEFYKRKLCS